jgi:hypothetical protein
MDKLEVEKIANKIYKTIMSHCKDKYSNISDEVADTFINEVSEYLLKLSNNHQPNQDGKITEFTIAFDSVMSKCTDPNDLIYAFYEIAKRIDKTTDLEIQVNDDGEAEIWQCYPAKGKLIEKHINMMKNNNIGGIHHE